MPFFRTKRLQMFTVVWIYTTRSTLISGITLFIAFVSFKPKVGFWTSLVDSTAFRFATNAASLLFLDSIRELVKFSPIPVSQFLQYNSTSAHLIQCAFSKQKLNKTFKRFIIFTRKFTMQTLFNNEYLLLFNNYVIFF